MLAGVRGDFSSSFCSSQKALLEQIWFDDVFEGVPFFAERCSDGVDAGRASVIYFCQSVEEISVKFIKAERVDLLHFECVFDDFFAKNA